MSVPQQTAFGEPLLSADDLARSLGMTRRWVYAQVEENGLPCYKLGRSLAFELSAVRAWLAERRIGNWPEERVGTGGEAPATPLRPPRGDSISGASNPLYMEENMNDDDDDDALRARSATRKKDLRG